MGLTLATLSLDRECSMEDLNTDNRSSVSQAVYIGIWMILGLTMATSNVTATLNDLVQGLQLGIDSGWTLMACLLKQHLVMSKRQVVS